MCVCVFLHLKDRNLYGSESVLVLGTDKSKLAVLVLSERVQLTISRDRECVERTTTHLRYLFNQ